METKRAKQKDVSFSGCGITGALVFGAPARKGDTILDRIDFEAMVRSLHHRGPEARGILREEGIRLGHTRLSILDLSDRGNQPMTRDHLTIVLNGEIYNFKDIRNVLEQEGFVFTSGTDTEVVLRAYQKWGKEALHKFNGMFAFAVWDRREKTLFIARDRLGIKPLYYYRDTDIFLFGSEVRALMCSRYIPPEINWECVNGMILASSAYYHELQQTLVKDVFALPPGHCMTVTPGGRFHVEKYWEIPEYKVKHDLPPGDLAHELRELMEDSIRLRLVSDVPVAAFLSGGMDSSVICALACRLLKDYKLTAITVSYEGGGKDLYTGKDDMDLEYSRKAAELLKDKIIHKIVNVKASDITLEAVDAVVDLSAFTEDVRFLTIHRNYREVKARDFKVVLNGEGADEIMGGYVGVNYVIKSFCDVQRLGEDLLRGAFPYLTAVRRDVLSEEMLGHVAGVYEKLHRVFHGYPGDIVEKAHRFFVYSVLQRILKLEDFYSMDSSIECRVPFLDHRLVEWVFRVPFIAHIRVEDRMGKMLLRQAFRSLLSDDIVDRPKQPFPSPDMKRTEKVLRGIYREHREAIVRCDVVRRVYREEFLGLEEPPMAAHELWQIIGLWRWAEKLSKVFQV